MTQNTDEWKEWRKGKIGCSDLPAIMGVSPWKTPLQLFEDKILGKESPLNPAMIRGSKMESEAREYINTKYNVNYKSVVIQDEDLDWLIASLDGYDPLCVQDPQILEIKCPGSQFHLTAMSGSVPSHYIPQVQGQMRVSGLDRLLYSSYFPNSCVEIVVERDDDYINNKLIPAAKAFKARLDGFEAPEASDKDRFEIDDPETKEMAIEYATLAFKTKNIEIEMKKLKEKIITKCSHNRNKIGNVYVSKFIRKGGIDYTKIPELKGIDLEQYRKNPMSYWVIGV